METSLTRRAFTVFEDALDIEDAGEREAWLACTCGGDEALLGEVKRLLRADAAAERAMPTGGLQPSAGPTPKRIGHYRIVDMLGQGGMGDVYIAARDDGLFDHVVAIKRIRPSLLPETARALFDRERRALAMLSHRHIAQLYDGGVDETGAPYFIMELVRGAPIDAYAADRDLSPRQIVEKMIEVCDAVQHAHQNLIVHADLKPANILVNDAGDPKVVDFGVARILRDPDDITLHPQTPGYASPQREAGASPTPADDVFALGAILRALLTGEAPRGAHHTVITSEAISKSPAYADRKPEWRAARARLVHGDLDAIVERACALAAEDRYQAAVALAADLRAWLDMRPLQGRSNDRLYAFEKFFRRHRLRVIGGAAASVSLVLALIVTSALYAQADFARKQAEARFTEVRSLAKYLLYEVYDRLERTPQTLAMRRDVAHVAQGYLSQLADTPSAPRDVLLEAADGFARIADLQAGRSRANLGDPQGALENLDRADQIAAALQKADPGNSAMLALRARVAMHHAAIAMNSRQELESAAELLTQANAYITAIPSDTRSARLLTVQHDLESAILGNWKATYAESEIHARKAIAIIEALPLEPRDARGAQYLRARAYDALAEAVYYGQSPAASEPIYQRLVDITSTYLKAHPDDTLGQRMAIEAHWALGATLLGVDRAKDGLAQMQAAAALVPTLLQYQPEDAGAQRTQRIVYTALAQALAMSGRFDEGVTLLREEVAKSEEQVRKTNSRPEQVRSYGVTLAMLADLFADNGIAKEACPIYAKAERVWLDLDKRGVLTQLDRDNAQKMVRDRQQQLKCV
ncbi:MAG: serine/threonine protein kinase [Hyphomonadaceae bacterium]|nr:serine/threonine protein kinase [Hyphomonadaceae bacterium]